MDALTPRSVGEILSDALALLRRRLGAFLVVALPFSAVELTLREAGSSFTTGLLGALAGVASGGGLDAGGAGPRALIGAAFYVAWFFATTAAAAALIRMTDDALRGDPPTARAGLDALVRRTPAVVGTLILWAAIVGLGAGAPFALVVGALFTNSMGALVVALLIAVPVAVVVAIVLLLRYALWTQVVVLEGLWGFAALSRAARVVASHGEPFFEGAKFRLSVLFLVAFGLSATVQSLFVIPRLVLGAADGGGAAGVPPLLSLPVPLLVPLALVEVAANAVLLPFGPALVTIFYRDARARVEGDGGDAA